MGALLDRINLVSLRVLGPIALTFVCSAASSDDRPRFHLVGLDVPREAIASAAIRINETGQISGQIGFAESIQVFRSESREMTVFANLRGYTIDYVADMNDHGVIIGNSPGYTRVPFLSIGETLVRIPLPGEFNRVSGINNRGEIAGAYSTDRNTWTGFVYSNGVLRLLPRLLPFGEVASSTINNNGEVVGTATTLDTNANAYALHAVVFSSTGITDLGTLPGDGFSSAADLNDAGDIVGLSIGERVRAFLYKDNTMREIEIVPPFISIAPAAVNNAGMVVGTAQIVMDESRAFLYFGSALYDLNELVHPAAHWVLQVASDINDKGQIVGYGLYKGQTRGFLLTPSGNSAKEEWK